MKRFTMIFLICSLIILPTFSRAVEICDSLTDFAIEVMVARQKGVPASSLVQIVEDESLKSSNQGSIEKIKRIAIEIISLAYDYPIYKTSEFQGDTVIEFRDVVYNSCLKAYNK